MAAISGKVSRIRVTSAAATNSTNEAATLSTDGVTLSIDSTAKRHWDRTSTMPSVFVSGATGSVNTDAKSINHVQGVVTFSTPHSTAATYTVDVDYLTSSYLAGGRNWSLDVNSNMIDVTAFSTSATDPKWRTYLPGLSDAEVSIERFYGANSTAFPFWDALNAPSSNLIVELVPDNSAGERYEGFARVAGFSPSVEIDGTADEGVTLQVDGTLYYTT
jgi:hypothetical protein